jgi:hypothetical protein
MGGVSFPGVSAPVVRWLRTEGYTAFSSFTHRLTLPLALWKDVEESSGRGVQEQASAAVLALGKALSDFEATAFRHLVNVAGL